MEKPRLPALARQFIDDGRLDRSKESFQGIVFKGLRQEPDKAISFSRSDFRGANISDCHFHSNNFTRADFISARVMNTRFVSCDFMTSFISNSIFENCLFKNNKNFNSDIYRCDMINCNFVNQPVSRAIWRDLRFTRCLFSGFPIERSTVENVTFTECDLSNADLSQMSAMDIIFENCCVEGTILDPDYLGSYIFISTPLNKLKFSYRTRNLEFSLSNPSDLVSLGHYLETQGRWSEAFNMKIIGMQLHPSVFQNNTLPEAWMLYLTNSIKLDIPSDASENILRMFRIAKLYLLSGGISISDTLMFIAFSNEISRVSMNGLAHEALHTGRASLLGKLQDIHNLDKLLTMDRHSLNKFRFQVQFESKDEYTVGQKFSGVMDRISAETGMTYQVLRIGYGSVLVEAISTLVIILIFFRAARSASYNLAEMRVAHHASKRFAEIARNAKDMKTAIGAIKTFRESLPPDPPISEVMFSELVETGKSIATLVREIRTAGDDILSLVKEVRIFIDNSRKRL